MAYKTILAYLPAPDRVPDLMNVVIPMAEKQGAHVIGLHIMAEVPVYGLVEMPMHTDLAAKQHAMRKSDAEQVRTAFEKACKTTDVATEWRCEDVIYPDFERVLSRQARLADLVVVSQKDNDPLDAWADLPTQLIMHSGRPVLMVPREGKFNGIGQKVIVAWNGSREAARAAFDALPLLKEADNVKIMVIDPTEDERKNTLSVGDDLALSLARHGVKAEATMDFAPDVTVPDELMSRASDYGSDLIVMGCYSHSRLREFIMGGATREIMNSMTVPVLMSH
ncbi:MAG: universal stress protein [Hyphomicrobiaceae bacterium]